MLLRNSNIRFKTLKHYPKKINPRDKVLGTLQLSALIFFFCLSSPASSSGQGLIFERTYGGINYDEGYSVEKTADGGYIIAGYTQSYGAGLTDVYLIKTFTSGDIQWTGTFGGALTDHGLSAEQISEDKYVVAGYTYSFGAGPPNVHLIKVDIRAPTILGAEASDNMSPVPGIDDDDQVFITFDEPTNRPMINALNIDEVLRLSAGHTWLDVFGDISDAVWNPAGYGLLITLSTTIGPPTVAVGDTITADGSTITDEGGNPTEASVTISGSFDLPMGIEDDEETVSLPRVFSLSGRVEGNTPDKEKVG